jgi:hypothetical protein
MTIDVYHFVRESNDIEGIFRVPFEWEVAAHHLVLDAPELTVDHLEEFVAAVQPGARLRDRPGMNVSVGRHIAPMGGPEIRIRLRKLLRQATAPDATPFHIYCEYENLHPFTDGNGRSGRALWLRLMGGPERAPLGFLRSFHYQALAARDA